MTKTALCLALIRFLNKKIFGLYPKKGKRLENNGDNNSFSFRKI